jgi:hypothetical protein
MRKFYSEPVLDITTFVAEDVMAVSTTDTWDVTTDFYNEEA